MRRERTLLVPKPIEGENRDAGKTFIVREVDAVQAEEWGVRALMAVGTSGIQIPQELLSLGVLAIPLIGYQVFLGAKEEAVLPLWREMLSACIFVKHSETNVQAFKRSDVEEVSTLLELRKIILELHTGFTIAELASKFASMSSAFLNQHSSDIQGAKLPAE